jgi:predicted ATPase
VAHELLTSCPRVALLVTSREPLGLVDEVTWPVPPLGLPPLRSGPLGAVFLAAPLTGEQHRGLTSGDPANDPVAYDLASYDAVRLFVERAVNAWPAFRLSSDNALDVARICWRLDGLPVAIEMAATQMRSLTAGELAEELENKLGAVFDSHATRPGYRMMRGLVEWNYLLLEPAEQVLLRRLSVFAGEFTALAAEEICAGGGLERAALDEALAGLVDKSLVERGRPDEDAGDRYRLLALIAEYGREQLVEAGEESQVRDCFVDYYVRLVEADGPASQQAERANLQRALSWAAERDAGGTGGAGRDPAGAVEKLSEAVRRLTPELY